MTLSSVVGGNVGRVSLTVDRCAGHKEYLMGRWCEGPAGAGLLVLGTVCFVTRGDVRCGKCGGRDGGDTGEGIRSGVGPRGVPRRFGIGDEIMRRVAMEGFR